MKFAAIASTPARTSPTKLHTHVTERALQLADLICPIDMRHSSQITTGDRGGELDALI